MGKLEGWTCDGCGNQQPGELHNLGAPYGWYTLYHRYHESYTFCSRTCLEQWLLGKAIVPEVEPRKVLFMKWLKSLVR